MVFYTTYCFFSSFFFLKIRNTKGEKWWCSEWERTDSSDSLDMNQYWAVVAHYYSRSVAIYSSHTEVTANDDLHFQTAHWEVSTRCYRRGLLANLQLPPPLVSCNSESLKSGACRLHWSDCLCVVVLIPFMPLPVSCAFIKPPAWCEREGLWRMQIQNQNPPPPQKKLPASGSPLIPLHVWFIVGFSAPQRHRRWS